MPDKKKKTNKKGDFTLVPITLSEPIKIIDGFTNLIDNTSAESERSTKDEKSETQAAAVKAEKTNTSKIIGELKQSKQLQKHVTKNKESEKSQKDLENSEKSTEKTTETKRLTEAELLQILDADNLNEIYELSDVLRASSLKLYAALVQLADSRGRIRVKNHELMAKAGIKGIATLYKQERWLTQLKLVEKKAKPGPHDGSSYFIFKLESLPLPDEIYNKFADYLSSLK